MFKAWLRKFKSFLTGIREAVTERRQKRLAGTAAMERRERKALIQQLAKKLERAHIECEKNKKPLATIEFSLKEITFIEWNLNTWSRYLKESEIFEPSPEHEPESRVLVTSQRSSDRESAYADRQERKRAPKSGK